MSDGWKVEVNSRRTTIGHWRGNCSIYQSKLDGKCVLSSGYPDYIGPIHTETLEQAKAAAPEATP